ncbi:carbohydrate ABC transporter permease [Eisenbergiella tayi]|uniref:carbohydrate ABC transporter permease n=1 Tax=Eisenbergiella tayi TaxID=1432052 RepID=UPI0002135514|nr:carbohydrate ABC transporter permease [Eisenbergiella tayi]EGN32349.1 multiple sugar transport system permease [Lachnospiraceae bacterium 3_1_57FAA_CT1]
MKIKSSPARKVFLGINYFFLTLVMCISLFPLIHIFALSLSSNSAAQAGWVTIFPVNFTWDSYQYILAKPEFFQSFGVSVVRVVLGTVLSVALTILSAYAMSQPDERFHARKYYVWVFMVTMVFSGGLIPMFIVVKSVGIYNSIWSLILPSAVQTFNIILMLNFFRGLPYALTESALIDGANHFQIMTKIVVPISKPSLATVGLFTMVNHWNSWFDGMIYLSDTAKYPLQTYLRNVIQSVDIASIDLTSVSAMTNVSQKTVTAAQIFVAIIPILLVYPLLQKYFITGMTLGSVKE